MSEESIIKSVRSRLFIMMVLEFFIWGAWLPLVWPYMGGLGFSGKEQALIGSCFAIASIIAIFFSNELADRKFSSERFMAFSHLVGGLSILGLFFVPTISVSNSLAFANLRNPKNEFGIIRMGGTIGWILASWPLYFLLKGQEGEALQNARAYIYRCSGSFICSCCLQFDLAAYASKTCVQGG